LDSNHLESLRVMNDMLGQPALLLRVKMDRDIMRRGADQTSVAFYVSLGFGLVVVALLWFVIRREITGPLEKLTGHADDLARDGKLGKKIDIERSDEIGVLAKSFEKMSDSLAEARAKELSAAHESGMVDVAREVLHNIGNALNSMNVATEMLQQKVQNQSAAGLPQTVGALKAQGPALAGFLSQEQKAAGLLNFLEKLQTSIDGWRNELIGEIGSIRRCVGDMTSLIASHHSLRTTRKLQEDIDVSQVIDDALRISRPMCERHEVTVATQLAEGLKAHVDRAQLMQVINNLIANSIDAIVAVGPGAGPRKFEATAIATGDEFILITICDSGVGFSPEQHASMFRQGFTTKSNGQGIGLHYCANAIRAAGGDITASSPGLKQGAKFTIKLPLAHKARPAKAA
jgi:two-component system, NtrC family, sensor kinase